MLACGPPDLAWPGPPPTHALHTTSILHIACAACAYVEYTAHDGTTSTCPLPYPIAPTPYPCVRHPCATTAMPNASYRLRLQLLPHGGRAGAPADTCLQWGSGHQASGAVGRRRARFCTVKPHGTHPHLLLLSAGPGAPVRRGACVAQCRAMSVQPVGTGQSAATWGQSGS